jgi:hypothetical protein
VIASCKPAVNPNALVVSGKASTDTWFAKIFGIDHYDISAHANACSPCSSSPVDIVIAIDRTGSMCDNNGPSCEDLDNAKDGVRTMLGIFDPPSAQIGMVAFPPLKSSSSSACDAPFNSLGGDGFDAYDGADRGYVTDTITAGYKLDTGALDPANGLSQHTEDGPASSCIQAGGNTSYSEALRQAQAELVAHGRPDVPAYIVFLTDGEANIGSVYGTAYPPGNSDDQQPCQTAIDVAAAAKKAGTTIYSIGYALGTKTCTAGAFHKVDPDQNPDKKGTEYLPCTAGEDGCMHYAGPKAENPPLTSRQTLTAIASPGDFYEKAAPGDLNAIFATIATKIGQGSSRLVDDNF